MGVAKELFELGFKKISKATMNFLETGVPRTDHAGIIRAATNSPQELTEYIRHADNFVKKKDQRGILPMIQYSDKWNNEAIDAARQADTLSLGTTPVAKQDALYQTKPLKLQQMSATTQPGVIKGSSARKILGSQQLANPPAKRSKSIPPNLPQEVIDEYTQESATRLRAGEKNRIDVPYLVDADDRVYRLDQKGWEYDGDIKQKKYALIDVDLKRARNAKLDKIRQQKVNLTTKAGTDQKDFYADPDPKARHKKGIEEPHHRAPLHPSARLKSGLSKREGSILDNYLESKGIVTGNSKYNRDNLPNEVHKKLHSWLKKNKLLTGDDDLTGLSLLQRKKYIDKFIADMKKSDEKTFKIMQAFTRLKKK